MREYSNAMVNLLGCIGPVIIDIHVKFLEVNRRSACFALSVCVAFLGPFVNSLMIGESYFNSKLFSIIGKVLAFLLLFTTKWMPAILRWMRRGKRNRLAGVCMV